METIEIPYHTPIFLSFMLVIGVVGGVASGKSLVTRCLDHLGAHTIDADVLGHEVLHEKTVIDAIVNQWGNSLLVEGQIDRKRLARVVFAPGPEGEQQLATLEKIVHPKIGARIDSRIQELQAQNSLAVVLDAPVMIKAGWDQFCDKLIFVEVPKKHRQSRAASRGWEPGELERRENKQTPLLEKRQRATDVIDNSGSKQETYDQVKRLWVGWDLALPASLGSPDDLFS